MGVSEGFRGVPGRSQKGFRGILRVLGAFQGYLKGCRFPGVIDAHS